MEEELTPLVERYYEIMKEFREGKYGQEHLVLYEILTRAGEPDLLRKMSSKELRYIGERTFGIEKMLFNKLAASKEIEEENMCMEMLDQPKRNSLKRRKTNNNKGRRNNGNK